MRSNVEITRTPSSASQVTDRYQLIGVTGSPYSVKMRALMRYRRLPFDWIVRFPQLEADPPAVRPLVVPILRFPEDGSYHVDSTPLAHALEARHPGQRSVIPDDPALAFLGDLIEDLADEWVTKMMFHYRWYYSEDAEYCRLWIASDMRPDGGREEQEQLGAALASRQIDRMRLVGCTPENKPVIEGSFNRLVAILDGAVRSGGPQYLFGSRPSLADFALYGQLLQLATDPVPAEKMRIGGQGLFDWLRRLDDASGVEGTWLPWDEASSSRTLISILVFTGEIYLPFLAANASAIRQGAQDFALLLDGMPYRQAIFKYQPRCFERLRTLYRSLAPESRERVDPLLSKTGCRPFLDS
jgi:glutathione S-transferase